MITILNLIANIILCISMVLFYLYLYGDVKNKHIMNKWTMIQHWSLRVGLLGIIAGSFFNILTLSTPPITEVVLNIGLALTFFWAYKFHKFLFDKKQK